MLAHVTSLGISRRWDDCDHPAVKLEARDRWCDVVTALVLDRHDREIPAGGEIVGEQVVVRNLRICRIFRDWPRRGEAVD